MTRNHTRPSRRTVLGGAVAALAVAAGTGTGQAAAGTRWPTEFPLPDGWLPEGITIGGRPYAYMGSRADGAIYRTDLRTGEGGVLHEGAAGLASIGLKLDRDGLLYVAGGAGGTARIVDARTGELLTTYRLTRDAAPFVNDVVLHGDRAWFTDSRAAVLHGVPRGRRGEVRSLPLTGEWVQAPAGTNSANGLVATPDGRGLIVVNAGRLYRVDLRTGHATEVTLRGAPDVAGGDGLVRLGRTLYVVQNRLNKITVWDLDRKATTAGLTRTITDPRFDVPTTAARHGNRLYLVNARFTSPQTPETTFNAVAVSL
ncbi:MULTISPECIES: SMP-30/gluconolactonase/LRE family protein [Streptomyces]|uniref:Gluconolactonase n=1 Tax=Streptomyces chartreusis NRRL 3882 TaxID=1079985 RepID=A0A2N9BF98_STRCX|nr:MULTISPECIES: superoxide dismutase [Streptomyces]MYS95409.1 superoxide dismutase [Streptomyces sp. SID5464]SOR82011.1 Gluconolactonase [Streptomyces chartreusis NRRL 3882]